MKKDAAHRCGIFCVYRQGLFPNHGLQTVDLHAFCGEIALVLRHDVGSRTLGSMKIPGKKRDLKRRCSHRFHGIFKQIRIVGFEAELSAGDEEL